MVFNCLLCENETIIISRFCSSCQKLKRIMNVYGSEKCLKILEKCCIRDDEQIDRKVEYCKKNASKIYGEKADDQKDYINPKK